MRMKQSTNGQHWYDELSSVFSIEEFPPLHSFSFNDWHWIGDEDLVHDHRRPLKTVITDSPLNDFWMIIIDEYKDPKQPLYSDIVQHQHQPYPSYHPKPSPAKVIHRHNKRHVPNVQSVTHHEEQEEDQWPLVLHRRRLVHPPLLHHHRSLKRTLFKTRNMPLVQQEEEEKDQKQSKGHGLIHPSAKKKVPFRTRRIQHRTRTCTHR